MGSYPARLESGPWPTLAQAADSVWTASAGAPGQGSRSEAAGSDQGEAGAPSTGSAPASTVVAQPPTQQVAPPTPPLTIAGQTLPKAIQPIVVIGQNDQTLKGP